MAVKTIDLQPKIDTATPTQLYLADTHSEIPATGNPGDVAICLDCGDQFTFLTGQAHPKDRLEGFVSSEEFEDLKRRFDLLVFMLASHGFEMPDDILKEIV